MTARPDWYYDERRQVGLDFADEHQVETYDARQSGSREEDERLLDDLELERHHVMADIGCGTGHLALAAARRCAQVHAADVSETMLAGVERRARAEGLANVTCHHAGFLSLDLPDGTLDLVTSKFALHHLPDLWKGVALARLQRMLKPSGRLFLRDVVFSCSPHDLGEVAEDWSRWMVENTGYARAEVACHIREEHSTYAWVLEGLIRAAGFRLVSARYDGRAYGDFLAVKD